MGEEQQSADFIALKTKILETIGRLKTDYKMFKKEIAAKIKITKDSFYKYARGEFPPTKIDLLKKIMEKLKELEDRKKLEKQKKLENPEEQKKPEKPASGTRYHKPSTEQSEKKWEDAKDLLNKSLVCIYYSLKLQTIPYNGYVKKIGAHTMVKGLDAIIAYPNDSIQFEDADGLVPMLDHGGEPSVRFESLIAIKKIDINYCRSGNQYYIFDKANQPFLRTLYKENGKYRLVAENSKRFPDLELDRKEIAVAFKVIIGAGKPKPKIQTINQLNTSNEADNEAKTEFNNPES
jgi:predicted XRE-type DNA-binding protein